MATSTKHEHSALRLKNDGNALFAECKFREAVACYTEGLLLTEGGEGEDLDLRAVLLSNRSGAYYEMGDYEKSSEDGRACCALLMEIEGKKFATAHEAGDAIVPPTLPPLHWKNLWRIARSLHFSGSSNPGEIHFVLNFLESESEEGNAFSAKASEMRGHLMYYQNIINNDDGATPGAKFEPSPIRASLQDPYYEYYNFGHDVSTSLLVHPKIDAQSIHLKDLTDDELSSLAVLFGGVGDGRHVFATLLDAHYQYTSLPSHQQEKFNIHITMNDISAQLLAKDILVFVLAHEMGRLASDCNQAMKESEPFFLGVVIMYMTLGHAMPSAVYAKMVERIKFFFTESSHNDFLKRFPWMQLSKHTWEGITHRMKAWIDPKGYYSPELPSVKRKLDSLRPSDNSTEGLMGDLAMMGAGGGVISDMQSRLDRAKEENKRVKLEMIEKIKGGEISPALADVAKRQLGEDAPEQDVRDFLSETLSNIPDDDLVTPPALGEIYVSNYDKLFYEMTKALAICASSPAEELNEDLALLVDKPILNKTATKAISQYKPKLLKSWVTNPVQIDPLHFNFMKGRIDQDETNHLSDWPAMFLNADTTKFFISPPVNQSNCQDHDKIRDANSLCKNVIRYYWNVGKVISNLSGKISIEIALGSIISLGTNSDDRNDLPTKYHRISLSNIPDYTGMLSVFCTIAPLLAPRSESITPSLRSNCLLNTGIWKSYDDYIFSTVSLSYQEAEDIFRLRVADEEANVFNTFTTWERRDTDGKDLAMTHQKLRLWIHSLYLSIILPPDRCPDSMLREERASTVDLFLLTLSACVRDLGIPSHVVSSAIEEILSNDTLISKATLSNDSPASISSRDNMTKKKYNISAFKSELSNQVAIFLQNKLLGFQLLDTSVLPCASSSRYSLKLREISPKYDLHWGNKFGGRSSSVSLGFMLSIPGGKKKFDISSGASDGNTNPMMSFLMAGMDGMADMKTRSSKLRKALLGSGSFVGHVFSCMQWDLSTQTASFVMCDDMFNKYRNYSFTLIRTDGWFQIPHGEARLGDAIHIG
eukprot:CAMPEP_0181080430 /NCGR_PEP_ID=MMETSP1071-20121207/2563_1 /TAXON_ID=35127 /ORGANISM="Thalassiosira sp., Strain NH16" /LENGTH=1044 /DNA_ID=CAMNT_0023161907 /DNA_START=65 /DNA_END=3199 /DNA_ORIENTATION=-